MGLVFSSKMPQKVHTEMFFLYLTEYSGRNFRKDDVIRMKSSHDDKDFIHHQGDVTKCCKSQNTPVTTVIRTSFKEYSNVHHYV